MMKKLDLEQMEKVNGGISERRCNRMERRFWRNFGTERGRRIIAKMIAKGC